MLWLIMGRTETDQMVGVRLQHRCGQVQLQAPQVAKQRPVVHIRAVNPAQQTCTERGHQRMVCFGPQGSVVALRWWQGCVQALEGRPQQMLRPSPVTAEAHELHGHHYVYGDLREGLKRFLDGAAVVKSPGSPLRVGQLGKEVVCGPRPPQLLRRGDRR
jgi:hypothetical protein